MRRGASDLPTHLLCAPGVLKLQKMSDRGGVDFIGTLSVYVENLYNASQTAKALCIHRDTLQYRLERIADIAHLDLSDSNDRLYLEISLLLLGKAGCRPIENGLCDT